MNDLRRYTRPITNTDDVLVVDRPEWTPRGLVGRVSIMETHMKDGHSTDSEYFVGHVSLTSIQERLTLHRLLCEMWGHAWRNAYQPNEPEPQDLFIENSATLLWALGDFFSDIVSKEQNADVPINLGEAVAQPMDSFTYELDDAFSLLQNHPTIFFGEGESGKSLLAFYFAGLLAQSKRVLIVDYELQASDHKKRMDALFGSRGWPSTGHPIHYLRAHTPIPELVPMLREFCAEHRIEYLFVDSVAPALGGSEAEKSESAVRYFRALSDIGVAGTLSIAHRAKSSFDKKGEEKPFGSGFWHHLARETYLFEKQEPGVFLISPRKANLRSRPSPVTARVTFAPDSIGITLERTEESKKVDKDQSLCDRAAQVMLDNGNRLLHKDWQKLCMGGGMNLSDFTKAAGILREKERIVLHEASTGQTKFWTVRVTTGESETP